MQEINIEVAEDRLVIHLGQIGLNNKSLMQRVDEVLPLLRALVSADHASEKLSEEEFFERGRGCMAISMRCQFLIQEATRQAELLRKIADGSETISDHGFPEFDGGPIIDV